MKIPLLKPQGCVESEPDCSLYQKLVSQTPVLRGIVGQNRKVNEGWRDPSNLLKAIWPEMEKIELEPRLFTLS